MNLKEKKRLLQIELIRQKRIPEGVIVRGYCQVCRRGFESEIVYEIVVQTGLQNFEVSG